MCQAKMQKNHLSPARSEDHPYAMQRLSHNTALNTGHKKTINNPVGRKKESINIPILYPTKPMNDSTRSEL